MRGREAGDVASAWIAVPTTRPAPKLKPPSRLTAGDQTSQGRPSRPGTAEPWRVFCLEEREESEGCLFLRVIGWQAV